MRNLQFESSRDGVLDTENSLKEAAKHLKSVYWKRLSILGPKHLDTVSARRELIATNCTLGRWEPTSDLRGQDSIDSSSDGIKPHKEAVNNLGSKEWGRIEAESHAIITSHEGVAGKCHPETLKSLLWLLQVKVHLQNVEYADKTLKEGLQRIRHASVRVERFLESIDLELKFALAVSKLGKQHEVEALIIMKEAKYAIEGLSQAERKTIGEGIDILESRTSDDITELSRSVVQTRLDRQHKLQEKVKVLEHDGRYREAATCQTEHWKLLAATRGPYDARAIDAHIRVAQLQLSDTEKHDKENGVLLLKEIKTRYSRALLETHILLIAEIEGKDM
ncbi:hypothetical protein F4808DRAFT_35177 [Astrocystis sublimbata]|nr:hypothetical protein F4808DRAFT_35131 [Astrocystis sublimbata]KAI0189458.1 hypothetical protein F4808DRAFT_35177 [Astrocystis sublimbata]